MRDREHVSGRRACMLACSLAPPLAPVSPLAPTSYCSLRLALLCRSLLRRRGSALSDSLLAYFLKHFFLKAQSCQLGNVCVTDWCLHILCGGEAPSSFLKQFRARANFEVEDCTASAGSAPPASPICGRFLSEGDYVYSCRTCQVGISNVICPQCFHDGNRHVGHDFIVQVTAGGTCDCGDCGWATEGVCDTHRRNKEMDEQMQLEQAAREESARLAGSPEYIVSVALRYRLRVLLFAVVSFVCSTVASLLPHPTHHRRFQSVVKVLSWVRKVAKSSSVGSGVKEMTDALALALCAPFDREISTTIYDAEYINQRLLDPVSAGVGASSSTAAPMTRLHFLLHHCCQPLPHFAPSRLDRILSELCYTLLTHAVFKRAMTLAMVSQSLALGPQMMAQEMTSEQPSAASSPSSAAARPYSLYRRLLIGQCRLPSVVHSLFIGSGGMDRLIVRHHGLREVLRCLRDVLVHAVHMREADLPTSSAEIERKEEDKRRRSRAAAGQLHSDGHSTAAVDAPPSRVHWASESDVATSTAQQEQERRNVNVLLQQQLAALRNRAREDLEAVRAAQAAVASAQMNAMRSMSPPPRLRPLPPAAPSSGGQAAASSSVAPAAAPALAPASPPPAVAPLVLQSPSPLPPHLLGWPGMFNNLPRGVFASMADAAAAAATLAAAEAAGPSVNAHAADGSMLAPSPSPSPSPAAAAAAPSSASESAAITTALYGQGLPDLWLSTALVPRPRLPAAAAAASSSDGRQSPPPAQAPPAVWFYNRPHSLSFVLSSVGYPYRVAGWNDRCASALIRSARNSTALAAVACLPAPPLLALLRLQTLLGLPLAPLTLDASHPLLSNHVFLQLKNDCMSLLDHRLVCADFLADPESVAVFLSIVALIQGAHPVVRQLGTHVDYERSETEIKNFFYLEVMMHKMIEKALSKAALEYVASAAVAGSTMTLADQEGSRSKPQQQLNEETKESSAAMDEDAHEDANVHSPRSSRLLPVPPSPYSSLHAGLHAPASHGLVSVSSPSIPLRSPYHAHNQLRMLQRQRELLQLQRQSAAAAGRSSPLAAAAAVDDELEEKAQQLEADLRATSHSSHRVQNVLRIMQSEPRGAASQAPSAFSSHTGAAATLPRFSPSLLPAAALTTGAASSKDAPPLHVARPLLLPAVSHHSCVRCTPCPSAGLLSAAHLQQLRSLLHNLANHLLFDFAAQGLPITMPGMVAPAASPQGFRPACLQPIAHRVLEAKNTMHQPLQRMFARVLCHVLSLFRTHIASSPSSGGGLDDFLLFESPEEHACDIVEAETARTKAAYASDGAAAAAMVFSHSAFAIPAGLQYTSAAYAQWFASRASSAQPPSSSNLPAPPAPNKHLQSVCVAHALSFWLCYLERPLRVLVWASQLRAQSLWVRNGSESMSTLLKNYKSTANFWRRGCGADLAAIQCATVEILKGVAKEKKSFSRSTAALSTAALAATQAIDGADLLMERLVDRWDASWWVSSVPASSLWSTPVCPANPPGYSTAETLVLAEDFLKLVHALVCDRSYVVCDVSLLRCFVIHILLAYGDLSITHSQILQFLPADLVSGEAAAVAGPAAADLDKVIAEVAIFHPPPANPSGGSSAASRCGCYTLRPELFSWTIPPALYWKYTGHDSGLAEEKMRAWKARQKLAAAKAGIVQMMERQASTGSPTAATASAASSSPPVVPAHVPPYFESLLSLLHTPTLHSFMFTLLSLALGCMEASKPKPPAALSHRQSSSSSELPALLFPTHDVPNGGLAQHFMPTRELRPLPPRSMAPGADLPLDRMMQQLLHLLALALTYLPGVPYADIIAQQPPKGFAIQPSYTHITPFVWDGSNDFSVAAADSTPASVASFAAHPSHARLSCLISLLEQLWRSKHMSEFAHEMQGVLLLAQVRLVGRPPLIVRAVSSRSATASPDVMADTSSSSSAAAASSSVNGAADAAAVSPVLDARALAKIKAKNRQAKLLAKISNEQLAAAKQHGLALDAKALAAAAAATSAAAAAIAGSAAAGKSKGGKKKRTIHQAQEELPPPSSVPELARIPSTTNLVAQRPTSIATLTAEGDIRMSDEADAGRASSPSAVPSPLPSPTFGAASGHASSPSPVPPPTSVPSDHARCCLCHEGADAPRVSGEGAAAVPAASNSSGNSHVDPRVAEVLGMVCFLTPTSLGSVAHRTHCQQMAQRLELQQQHASGELRSASKNSAHQEPQSYQSSHPSPPSSHHLFVPEAHGPKQPLGALAAFQEVAQKLAPEAFMSAAAAATHKRNQERDRRDFQAAAFASSNNLAPPTLMQAVAEATTAPPASSAAAANAAPAANMRLMINDQAMAPAGAASSATASVAATATQPSLQPIVAPVPTMNRGLAMPSVQRSISAPDSPAGAAPFASAAAASSGSAAAAAAAADRAPPPNIRRQSSAAVSPAHPAITFDWAHSLGLHLQTCTHFMHIGCLETYLTSKYGRSSSSSGWRQGAPFLCPACRRLSNVIIPTAMETDSKLMPPPLRLCAPVVESSSMAVAPPPLLRLDSAPKRSPSRLWHEFEAWSEWVRLSMQRESVLLTNVRELSASRGQSVGVPSSSFTSLLAPHSSAQASLAVMRLLSVSTVAPQFAPPSQAFLGVIKHFIHIVSYMLRGQSSAEQQMQQQIQQAQQLLQQQQIVLQQQAAARLAARQARAGRVAPPLRVRVVEGLEPLGVAARDVSVLQTPLRSPSVSPTPAAMAAGPMGPARVRVWGDATGAAAGAGQNQAARSPPPPERSASPPAPVAAAATASAAGVVLRPIPLPAIAAAAAGNAALAGAQNHTAGTAASAAAPASTSSAVLAPGVPPSAATPSPTPSLFSAASLASYMRIFLCIAGNTCTISEVSIRQQTHSLAAQTADQPSSASLFAQPMMGELLGSSVFSFAPLLPALLSSTARPIEEFYSSELPAYLAQDRQHRIFALLIMLYRLTRQQWIVMQAEANPISSAPSAIVKQKSQTNQRNSSSNMDMKQAASSSSAAAIAAFGSASSSASPSVAAAPCDTLEDIHFLWHLLVGNAHDSSAEKVGAAAAAGDDNSHNAAAAAAAAASSSSSSSAMALTLPLLSRNLFGVLVQLTPMFLRLSEAATESPGPGAVPVPSSASPAVPTAEQHALGMLRLLYLAVIAQSVAYVSSLGVRESDTQEKVAGPETVAAADAVATGSKRKGREPPSVTSMDGSAALPAALATAPAGGLQKKPKLERGVTMPLDGPEDPQAALANADTSSSSAAAAAVSSAVVEDDRDDADMSDAFSASSLKFNSLSTRAQIWQRAAERVSARLVHASPHELLLSTACITDVHSIPSLVLFARAARLRLVDLTLPFHLHVEQQQERQASLRADGRVGSAPWTSLCSAIADQPVAQAVQQLCTPFVRQSAVFLSSIFQTTSTSASSPSTAGSPSSKSPLLDFASIFPSLLSDSPDPPSAFSLGPQGHRLIWQWFQSLYLPVWAKRAMAAGANHGRTCVQTKWPRATPTTVSPAAPAGASLLPPGLAATSLSPPPLLSLSHQPPRTPPRSSRLSVSPSLPHGIISPPKLSAAVQAQMLSVPAQSQSNGTIAAAVANSTGSSASSQSSNSAARWALSSFSPYQATTEGAASATAAAASSIALAPRPPSQHPLRSLAVPASITPSSSPTPLPIVSSAGSARSFGPVHPPFPCVSGDVGDAFSFCGLPALFHSFLSASVFRSCVQCRTRKFSLQNKTGADNLCVCLLCGSFVCMGSSSSSSSSAQANKCYMQHLLKCDGRIGLYLLLKRGGEVLCILHSSGGTAACFWPSLYLDRYGEPDPGLARGKPLYLHPGRVAALTKQYQSMQLQDYISSHAAPIPLQAPVGAGAVAALAAITTAGAGGAPPNFFARQPTTQPDAGGRGGMEGAGGVGTGGQVTVMPGSFFASMQAHHQQQHGQQSRPAHPTRPAVPMLQRALAEIPSAYMRSLVPRDPSVRVPMITQANVNQLRAQLAMLGGQAPPTAAAAAATAAAPLSLPHATLIATAATSASDALSLSLREAARSLLAAAGSTPNAQHPPPTLEDLDGALQRAPAATQHAVRAQATLRRFAESNAQHETFVQALASIAASNPPAITAQRLMEEDRARQQATAEVPRPAEAAAAAAAASRPRPAVSRLPPPRDHDHDFSPV